MIPLSAATLSQLGPDIAVPDYDRRALRGGIVHFGVGNFHRTQLAVYVDACLRHSRDLAWGIVGIGPTDGADAREKAAGFAAQDCLYTVTECSPEGDVHTRVTGAMIDYIHGSADPDAVLARLVHPDAKMVTLTITEGGYNIRESDGSFMLDTPDVMHDLAGGAPRSVFGFVVEALARRRAAGMPALTIVSCDNLRGNGDTARKAFVSFAQARDPDLANWIDRECDFPNSMVDRIAPQVTPAERQALNERSGVADRLPAKAESFNQWVVEDRFRYGRPAFEQVGVQFSDDVASHLAVKGRMINACHMLLAYPSILCGYRIVDEAMRDPRMVRLLMTFVDRDVVPHLQGPPGLDIVKYKAMILERFSNPAIGDQLLRVAGDGAAKIPIFHSKTVSMLAAAGADMRREAFLMACFSRYLAARDDDSVRDDLGHAFVVNEPGLTEEDWNKVRQPNPLMILETSPFRSLGLARHPAFATPYAHYVAELTTRRTSAVLDDVLA